MKFLNPFRKNLFCAALIFGAFFCIPSAQAQTPGNEPRTLKIERIEIQGNWKTKRGVILDYCVIVEEQALTQAELPDLLDESWYHLTQTGFFQEVDLYPKPGAEKGGLIIVIEIKERRWPYFQFEGGHSDLNGWYLVPASLRFDNFLGRGNTGGFRLFFGERVGKLMFNFRTEKLFDRSMFLDVTLESGAVNFIHKIDDDRVLQTVGVGGLKFRVGGNRGWFRHFFAGYTLLSYEPESDLKFFESRDPFPNASFPQTLSSQIGRRNFPSFEFGLQGDFRDNALYPTKGFWGALIFERFIDADDRDFSFSKVTLDARYYQKLWKNHVLAVNLKSGNVEQNAPFYHRFYLGGANSMRGVEERGLTPVGYGTEMVLTHVEYRFPFSSRRVLKSGSSVVLFADAGRVWLPNERQAEDELYSSVGFGLRFKLPIIGLTRLDVAFPGNMFEEQKAQFHFSLGHSF